VNTPVAQQSFRIAVVSAGTSDPSSTRLLADRAADRATAILTGNGHLVATDVIELREIAADVSTALVTQLVTPKLQQAMTILGEADGIIASSPVYKAGASGLFKSFFDVLDNDLLIAKPVLLAATAGSSRHALVIDGQMRPLFGYMRALSLPTSVFAAPEDWGSGGLGDRIDRAAAELAVTVHAGIEHGIAERAWSGYQHRFAGNATRADQTAADLDFDSPLMRLAAGGRPTP